MRFKQQLRSDYHTIITISFNNRNLIIYNLAWMIFLHKNNNINNRIA